MNDDDLKRMFEEKLNGETGGRAGRKRRKLDRGELVQREDGVYRSDIDFPELKR